MSSVHYLKQQVVLNILGPRVGLWAAWANTMVEMEAHTVYSKAVGQRVVYQQAVWLCWRKP